MAVANTTADHSRKRRRLCPAHDGRTDSSATVASARARASLTSLPFEILAEILLYTRSPPTVLAVSRTSSFLYFSLAQNPAASFIWRGVRQTCRPALPDPGQLWKGSEAHYAAFVFGGGVCEVCLKATRAVYASFATRIRLCGSWHCRKRFLDEFLVDVTTTFQGRNRQSLWVPYVESSQCFHSSVFHTSTWPNNNILLRKTDWENFQVDLTVYKDADLAQAKRKSAMNTGPLPSEAREEEVEVRDIMERSSVAIERFPAIMEFSTRLIRWKCDYDKEYKAIKKQNKIWTKNLAEREGWNLGDLLASQAYGSLQRRKTFLLEKIESDDVSPIQSAIESELLAVQARSKRQKAEIAYKARLTEVQKIYEGMRSGTLGTGIVHPGNPIDGLILPPLSVFCTLPSVRALKGSPDPNAVLPESSSSTLDIKSSPLAISLIIQNLHTWLHPVQMHLMSLLGYPNGWQSANTRILPPLKRVTARFFCRRCGEGRAYRGSQRERCLDLKGVCSHVCVAAQKSAEGQYREVLQEDVTEPVDNSDGNRQGKKRVRGKKSSAKTLDWKVEVFERDDEAINLIRTIVTLAGLSEEDHSTASKLSPKGGFIRCMTCQGWIVMDFDTAIGHAHRHESMQVQLLATCTPSRVGSPTKDASTQLAFERGTSELLLGPSQRGRNLCKKVNYGCKHCLGDLDWDVELPMGKRNVKKGARAMNFNGLRSHVKEKHGIRDVCDEDFFCYSSVQNDSLHADLSRLG